MLRRFGLAAAGGLLALMLAVALIGVGPRVRAAGAQSGVAGYVYVNGNTVKGNSIVAFARQADGTLAPLTGSPFAAGGAGTGKPIASQGALQLSADGDYLIAVDAGSGQLSVLRVGADGAVTLVDDSPVSSGGLNPVSIAVHDDLVYVANAGDGKTGSNYTGFRLGSNGQLSPIAGSTVSLAPTANPGDLFFNSTGTLLIGTEVGPMDGPSFIDSFRVGQDGKLTAAAGSPFAAQAVGPFGGEFNPVNPNEVYISNAHAGANQGSVSAYTVASDGGLTPIGDSPYFNKQTAACWVEISHDGKYLFAVNTAVPSVSTYQIMADGSLSLLGSTVFNQPTGLAPFDARLDPEGHNLYVIDPGRNAVSVFAVNGGTLTELASSPVSLAAHAASIDPAGSPIASPAALPAAAPAGIVVN
jgi:6-phosphogluconolactonase (cycloisomerase 2 family)